MKRRPRDLTFVEWLVLLFVLAILALIFVEPLFHHYSPEAARRSACQQNLHEWHVAFKLYESEDPDGYWPSMQLGIRRSGMGKTEFVADLGPDLWQLYPDYLKKPEILMCPSNVKVQSDTIRIKNSAGEPCLDSAGDNPLECARAIDTSYAYLGWALEPSPATVASQSADTSNDAENMEVALHAEQDRSSQQLTNLTSQLILELGRYADIVSRPQDAPLDARVAALNAIACSDLVLPCGPETGDTGAGTIYRLRNGMERVLITDASDAQSAERMKAAVFVMMDNPTEILGNINHIPGGGNVLYLDGHVDYRGCKYPDSELRPEPYTDAHISAFAVLRAALEVYSAVSELARWQ